MQKKKLLLSAGGTGGHLFPAQSLARELKDRYTLLFVAGKLSSSPYFDKSAYAYRDISVAPLNLKALPRFIKETVKGTKESLQIIKEFSPDLIVGFGSYYIFPLLLAATLKRVPFILHEQNSMPGKVIRLFSRFAKKTAITFPEAANRLKGDIELVTFPVRFAKNESVKEEAYRYFGLNKEKKTLLVFGGSQGAKTINQLMIEQLAHLPENIQILHFTGDGRMGELLSETYHSAHREAVVKPFEPRMDLALSVADVVIGRSGASTVAELIEWEIPSILIPFPFASDNHQEINAKHFCEVARGGRFYLESTIKEAPISETIISLLSNEGEEKKKHLKEYKRNRQTSSFSDVIVSYL